MAISLCICTVVYAHIYSYSWHIYMHHTHIYGTYTHSMHIETRTPVCALIHKPSGNRVEHSHFPDSFHLHKGPGSLINESQLMPCCQYSSPTDWKTEPKTGQNASCCHHQHHVDVEDGWGTPMASDCTEIPSTHHAPGIPPSLAPTLYKLLHYLHGPFSLPHSSSSSKPQVKLWFCT